MSITREEWLNMGADSLRGLFKQHGYEVPERLRMTCGFPSRSAMSRKRQRIGECWDTAASADATHEIFISPVLAEPVEVLAVLAHEMVHATVGLKASHGAPFRKCALAIGLAGKMTATTAGDAFKQWATAILPRLGEYPHAKLDAKARSSEKKQGTRLIKCECADCGYTIRTTSKWLAGPGAPLCPCNSQPMTIGEGGQ